MSRYLRCRVRGGLYFFTVVTASRRPLLVEHADVLRQAFLQVRLRHPFHMEAIVILPDHLHCLWRLPPKDSDFSTRWGLIKGRFSQMLCGDGGVRCDYAALQRLRRPGRGERAVWQPRFWEHVIRDETDLERHADYIHYNPVRHGYVRRPRDWPYASFRRFVREGIYTQDWACAETSSGLDCE